MYYLSVSTIVLTCGIPAKLYLSIPRTSSSMRPFLAEGCAPHWRTTDPSPRSSSFSRSASLGSNAERQCSSLGRKKQRLVLKNYLDNQKYL